MNAERQNRVHAHALSRATSPLHEYFGYADGCYLAIQDRLDHISLGRVFGRVAAYWRYTHDGRILNVGVRDMEMRLYYPLLTLYHDKVSRQWKQGDAFCCALPDIMERVDKNLLMMPPQEQYQYLLVAGKENVGRLMRSFANPEETVTRKESQLPLHTIQENPRLHTALKTVMQLDPRVEFKLPVPDAGVIDPWLRITYKAIALPAF